MPGQWVFPLSVQVTELAICLGCLVLDKKTQFIAICIGFATRDSLAVGSTTEERFLLAVYRIAPVGDL